ncbi:hypothetical protein PG987_012133 [Apiospora arundinis]
MSGFEIAGVVLGAIPLLISALEHYKSGKSTVATLVQWQGQLDTLLFRLKNQKLSFFFDILELLRSANVEDVIDNPEITETECLQVLSNAKTGAHLQDYLGQHYDAFIEILGRYESCLKLIARKLKHIRRLPDVAKDDLGALLVANSCGKGGFAFHERISFSIEKGRLTQLIQDLNEDRLSLKTIIKGMRSQQEHTTKEPTKDSHKLATLLGQVQVHAQSLFSAVCKSCECSCASRHRVLLQLHNRIPPSKVRKDTSRKKANYATFKLALHMGDVLQEAIVEAGTRIASSQGVKSDTSQTVKPVNPSMHLSAPSIVVTQHSTTLIYPQSESMTICAFASQAKTQGSILHLTLNSNCLGFLTGGSENQTIVGNSVSLEEVLRRGSDDEDARMTYKEQTLLALDIACSIVQLRETLWLDAPLTSHILKVITHKRKNTFNTKPFIEQTPLSTTPSSGGPDPETVLRELAILLLELWHHRPLETWCAKTDGIEIATSEGRLAAAIRWMKATSERLPPHYLDAIEQCIGICCGRRRSWNDIEFLRLYCENVIMPLQESCRAWDVSESWAEFP